VELRLPGTFVAILLASAIALGIGWFSGAAHKVTAPFPVYIVPPVVAPDSGWTGYAPLQRLGAAYFYGYSPVVVMPFRTEVDRSG
jgi:hypothetical protein